MNFNAIVGYATLGKQEGVSSTESNKIDCGYIARYVIAENLLQDEDHNINYENVKVLATSTQYYQKLIR